MLLLNTVIYSVRKLSTNFLHYIRHFISHWIVIIEQGFVELYTKDS